MALIVGLGNPGEEYKGTRHNVGFELIDNLSEILTITLKPGNGLFFLGEGHFKGRKVTLVKPTTFMNNSGKAVSKALAVTGDSPADCLVCYDDIHLETGRIKLKPSGSAGGHNGMRDIINQLGDKSFLRLRVGVGHPGSKDQVVDYVLRNPSKDDHIAIDAAFSCALNMMPDLLAGDLEKAMQDLHTK